MTKKIKRLLTATSSLSSVAIAVSPALAISALSNNSSSNNSLSQYNVNIDSVDTKNTDTNKKPSKVFFDGKFYNSTNDAAIDYITNSGNASEDVYVGNVDVATSNSSPYKIIDLSKLRENDSTKFTTAYKKLSGQHTANEKDAKNSYLKEPQIKFIGADGKIFDLKSDAEESLLNSKQTSSVTYYEVADYNKLDLYGNPTIFKINPLNKNDQETLKKIALGNVSIRKDNEFTIERMSINSSNNLYDSNEYKGMGVGDYLNSVSKFKQILANKVRDKLWVSPELSVTPEQRLMKGTIVGGFIGIDTQFGVNYSVHSNPNNKYAGLSLSDLKKQSKILYDKNEFDKHFERTYDNYNRPTGNTALYRNAKTKSYISQNPISLDWPSANINVNTGIGNGFFPGILNPTIQKGIFGGQEYSFTLDNSRFIQTNFYNSMSEEAISFAGHGKKNNVWFNMGINQEGLEHNVSTNSEYRIVASKTATRIIDEFVEELRKNIDSNLDINLISTLKESLYQPIYKALTTKIINNGEYVLWNLKDAETIENYTSSLNDKIIYNINEVLNKSGNGSIETQIGSLLQRHKMSTENPSNLNTIYTISYNGVPLFRLGKEIIQLFSDSIEFKSDPLKTIRQGIKDLLISNFDGTVAKFLPSMHNVSNMLSKEKSADHKLSNKLDATCVLSNNLQNIDNRTVSFVNGEVDPTWGLSDSKVYLDEKMIGQLGFQDNSINRKLNLFESDGIDTLKMNGGTWASIHQYNKELKNALLTKNPNQAYKDNVLKNKISNLNDIVHLFEKDSTPKDIYYAEYLNYNSTFNPSLSNNSTTIVSSKEKRDYVVKLHGLNNASRTIQIRNHNNDVLVNIPITDNSQEGIESAKELAIKEALDNINLSSDNNYIYYKEDNGDYTLLENRKNKLYTLKLNVDNNSSPFIYGFQEYENMYNYLVDYIEFISIGSPLDEVVKFSQDTISKAQIESALNSYPIINNANAADSKEKFEKYGAAFGISTLDEWNKIIADIIFEEPITRQGTLVTMNVLLGSGYKLNDGTKILSMELTHNGGLTDLPTDDSINAIERNAANATIISATVAILAIIILEIIVIVTIMMNRRNDEKEVEYKLNRLSSRKYYPNLNLPLSTNVKSQTPAKKPITTTTRTITINKITTPNSQTKQNSQLSNLVLNVNKNNDSLKVLESKLNKEENKKPIGLLENLSRKDDKKIDLKPLSLDVKNDVKVNDSKLNNNIQQKVDTNKTIESKLNEIKHKIQVETNKVDPKIDGIKLVKKPEINNTNLKPTNLTLVNQPIKNVVPNKPFDISKTTNLNVISNTDSKKKS